MYKNIKRLADIVLSASLILVLCPLFIIVALLIKLKIGSPIIFKQERPGLNEKIFRIYKFRTMTNEKDENGNLLPGEKRMTKIGLLLRKASIDELPQLLNVLKGDMSFIGPRPLLVRYLSYYTEQERKRHNVRPGITGLAQVNGRNFLSWDKRLELDLEYVEKFSFKQDLEIFLKTIVKVFKEEGVARDKVTLDEQRKNKL